MLTHNNITITLSTETSFLYYSNISKLQPVTIGGESVRVLN